MTFRRLPLAFVVVLLLAGCGGSATTHPQTGAVSSTEANERTLEVYFYLGNALVPTDVQVPQTQAVATAALDALLAGPPPGYTTHLPQGGQLESLAISGGKATVKLSPSLQGLSHAALGQIVYTLTQFASVSSVDGTSIPPGSTRADFADLTQQAPIFVASPLRDSTVQSPVQASGTADVFEGTLAVDVYSNGSLLGTHTIQATSGSGQRGTWQTALELPPGPAKLVFYEPSAENGKPLHATTVEITVRAS